MKARVRDRLVELARGRRIAAAKRDDFPVKGEGPTAAVVVESEAEAEVIGQLYATQIGGAERLRVEETRGGVVIY